MSIALQIFQLAYLIGQHGRALDLDDLKFYQGFIDSLATNPHIQRTIGNQFLNDYDDYDVRLEIHNLLKEHKGSIKDYIDGKTNDEIKTIAAQYGYNPEALGLNETERRLASDMTFKWWLMLNFYQNAKIDSQWGPSYLRNYGDVSPQRIAALLDTPIHVIVTAIYTALQISKPYIEDPLNYLLGPDFEVPNLVMYAHIVRNGILVNPQIDQNHVYESLRKCTDLQIYNLLNVQDIAHFSRKDLLVRAYDIVTNSGEAYVIDRYGWIVEIRGENKERITDRDIRAGLALLVHHGPSDINLSQIYHGLDLSKLLTHYRKILPGGKYWNEAVREALKEGRIDTDSISEFMSYLDY